jgi:hypothetical protein
MAKPLAEPDDEQLEQALFIDLIRAAPPDTALVITSDSWNGLPGLFGERLVKVVEDNSEEWLVALTPPHREFLIAQALEDEVYAKFVHFFLVQADKELVTSYDRMACVIIDPTFPEYQRLVAEYAALGVILG